MRPRARGDIAAANVEDRSSRTVEKKNCLARETLKERCLEKRERRLEVKSAAPETGWLFWEVVIELSFLRENVYVFRHL